MEEIRYYIGIDGGGTKSRLLALNEMHEAFGQSESGSTNLASNPKEVVLNNLRNLFSVFFAATGVDKANCAGLCIGSAGIDQAENKRVMEELISQCGFTCPVMVVNDSQIVLAAATEGKAGVVLVCGTGSIALGMDEDGKTIRCGGWGHLLDDMGSAYWMGMEGIRLALRSYDGRSQKTLLELRLSEALGLKLITDCLDPVYNGELGKSDIAQLAPYVSEAAQEGDPGCMAIMDRAARELFLLIDAVLRKLKTLPKTVTVSGGTILNDQLLLRLFIGVMAQERPSIRVEKIKEEPIMGAVFLAQKHL